MSDRNSNIILALIGLCLCFSTVVTSKKRDCACPGPIKYYEELACEPVFKNPDDCCPVRYNCDKWKNLTDDQCMVNNHVYEQGEDLRAEDSNPCDSCSCSSLDTEKYAFWTCASRYCERPNFDDVPKPAIPGIIEECYQKRTPDKCCPSSLLNCSTKEKRPKCVVDGKTYKDGEFFIPSAEPEKHCYCGEGYKGENVEPFCILPKHTWCNNIIQNVRYIRNNCVPVYENYQSLRTDCNQMIFRCKTKNDYVINPKPIMTKIQDPDMLCKLGNITLQIGEELNREDTIFYSACIKCVCEVPPVLSCKRLPSNECNPWDRLEERISNSPCLFARRELILKKRGRLRGPHPPLTMNDQASSGAESGGPCPFDEIIDK